MTEEQVLVDHLKASFVEASLRLSRLEKEKDPAPGCIVRKGPQGQYCYWQKYVNGRQVQEYLRRDQVAEVEAKMRKWKDQKTRLAELKELSKVLEKLLRCLGIRGDEVLAEYEEQLKRKESEALSRHAAREEASAKRYAENYRHPTDRGDQVASKSEQIIANVLFAHGVKYEYERPFVVDGTEYKPDFTVWRPDGTMLLWEHAGLIDDPDYAWNFEHKLRMYQKVGYMQAVNVIVTYDENGAFSAAEARRMIDLFRLV